MSIGLIFAFFLVLTMVSLVLTLSSSAQVDKLRQQNTQMKAQIEQLKREYEQVLNRLKTMQETEAAEADTVASVVPGTATVFGAMPAAKTSPVASVESLSDTDKLELVKANAYRLKSLVESFAMEHGGRYPESLDELEQYSTSASLNEMVMNPFNQKKMGVASRNMCIDITTVPADEGIPDNAGRLLFQSNSDDDGHITDYTIAAFDHDGLLIRNDEGNIFTISRS